MSRTLSFVAGLIGCGVVFAIAIEAAPDPTVPLDELTPGQVATTDGVEVCGVNGYGKTYSEAHRRNSWDKAKIMRAYGLDPKLSAQYELDHRVPLALGGADAEPNLWPEPWTGAMNAHDKDDLEFWAYREVCVFGDLPLVEAQAMFLGDWREGYHRVFHFHETRI